jgi:hypothetical protein
MLEVRANFPQANKLLMMPKMFLKAISPGFQESIQFSEAHGLQMRETMDIMKMQVKSLVL